MALWSNTDAEASKPKYLNSTDKAATLGVSVDEAQTAGNVAKGINTPGWVKYTTYTDAQGNTRHKSEVLVAMGTITGDNDTIDPDPVITIGTQPQDVSVTEPEAATFSVVATATRNAVLTYLWQVSIDGGSTWNTASGATATTASFEIDPTEVAMDGHKYRCVVSATGATSVTSNAATLTVTA